MNKLTTLVAGALVALAGPAFAASHITLPGQLAWSAYGTGSAGYNQAVAQGAAIQEATGTNLRILPGKNDISRTEPLRQRKVEFSSTGVGGSFMAQEAAFNFGAENWGPQKIRTLIANSDGGSGLAVGVAADVGIVTYEDLKGKRVAWIRGAPALNVNVTAILAYAGLTWDDVERVDFGGFGDSWKGIVNNQVDAAFASTNSGRAYELEASPRGIHWPTIDPNNVDGISRMREIAPFFSPMTATVGAGIDGTDGVQTVGYAYPVLITMHDQDNELVYNMTKAMVELFDDYKDTAPGINGWALEKQNFKWVVPYHEGAIRYYKEIGAWTDEAQAHNDNLIARQEALAAAWEELKAVAPENWEEAWAEKRKEALAAGGFQVVF